MTPWLVRIGFPTMRLPWRCSNPETEFSTVLELPLDGTAAFACVRSIENREERFDLEISGYDGQEMRALARLTNASALEIPFVNGLPRRSDISTLKTGDAYRLVITVTDGNTVPVQAEANFVDQGEQES
jgi:hypothetical protein